MSNVETRCAQCAAPLAGGARFCHKCGAPSGAPTAAPPRSDRTAWLVAGVVVVVALIVVLATSNRPAPAAGPGGMPAAQGLSGRAPDISALSPRQAFDRLYDRVMAAAEAGDTATMVMFSTHALQAYTQLDSVDADARYHAAVLALQLGGYQEALALADTILATEPTHLFGFLIRGTVAELSGDAAALAAAHAGFRRAWSTESGRTRAEYLDHQSLLDEFRRAALAAAPE